MPQGAPPPPPPPPSKVPSTTTSTPRSSSSKVIPILGRKNSRVDSPSNSVTHSSSISSLGLIENYNRLNTYNSNDLNIDSSSDSSSDEDIVDNDIRSIRNDTSKFDKSKLRKSFEDVFKMDSLSSSPLSNRFNFTSDEEPLAPSSSTAKPKKSPNVFFKKLISKSTLKPQSKSFKRITKELQLESQPLQAEMTNEAAVTYLLKDEEILLEKGVFNNTNTVLKNETLKKYELINRANKLWSHSHGDKINNTINENNNDNNDNEQHNLTNNRKRKSVDISNNEVIDQSLIKRRVVSTSPNLTGTTSPLIPISRRNSKLMQSTSDDLEKMSL